MLPLRRRRLLLALVAALACAVLAAIGNAGRTVFVCAAMDAVHEHRCAHAPRAAAPGVEQECPSCKSLTYLRVRTLVPSSAPDIAPAPCVAMIPCAADLTARLLASACSAEPLARPPPKAPTPELLRVYLI